MSWLNPRLTTTRNAAMSSRFFGNVYAGTCQPRSRRAAETSNTEKLSTPGVSVNAKTGSSSPRVSSSNGPRPSICPASRVATSRAYCWTLRYPSTPSRRKL